MGRLEKYKAKLDSDILKRRYDDTKGLAIDQKASTVKKEVEIENKVKVIIDGEPSFLQHFYMVFAKELEKKGTSKEREILFNKWAARGLNFIKMREIGKYLFEEILDLRTIAPIPNLVGHWTFYEGAGLVANDLSGEGNDGTSPKFPTWTDGKIGNGLLFDGIDDSIDCGNGVSLNFDSGTQDFSIAAWVKVNVYGGVNAIVDKRDGNDDGFRMSFVSGKIYLSLNTIDVISATTFSSTDIWYHVVGVVNRTGNGQIYVNGVADGNPVAIGGEVMDTTINPYIGSNAGGGGGYFNGYIDEVMVFNKALSIEEIKKIYETTK